MEFEETLRIGAFGRLVGLSAGALRFYDDCGLLQPVRVDPISGYRSYAVAQERRAVLLRDLRAMGLPLAQVRVVLEGTPDVAAEVVQAHLRSLEEQLAPARQAAAVVLSALGQGWQVELVGPELASAVRQVAPAAAVTQQVPALACVLLDVGVEEVRLVATDRYRLAVRVLPVGPLPSAQGSVLLPALALADLAGWLVRHERVHVAMDGEHVRFTAGSQVRVLSVVDEQFPDYQAIVAALAPPVTRAAVNRTELLDVLLDGGLPAPVVLDLAADELIISLPDGTVVRRLLATCTGTGMRLGFAPAVLAAALSASVGPDVLLELAAPDRPVVVRSADQGSFTTLAMPTALTAAAG